MQEFMYGDITNVKYEMCDNTCSNWSHRNSNKRFIKKNFAAVPGNQSIDSLQNAAILGTSHITRKVQQTDT